MLSDDRREESALALGEERAQLVNGSRFRWYHWLAVALSALLTLYAWHNARTAEDARAERRFERETAQTIDLFVDRLRRYEDVLRASADKFEAHGGRLSREEWQRYTDRLDFLSEFPATSGLGVVSYVPRERLADFLARQRELRPRFRLRPEREAEFHLPLTFVVPSRLESRAPGLDLVHDEARREAALEAARTDTVRITRPVVPSSGPAPGFVMLAPFRSGDESANPDDAHKPFERLGGWIAASVIGADLADGLLDASRRTVGVGVRDGGDVLFDEFDAERHDTDPDPLFRTALEVPMYGRVWTFELRTGLAFRREVRSWWPEAILAGGLAIDALLCLVFVVGTRRNRLTLERVDERHEALSASSAELERANEELERFTYVVSHDLKAPLLGVRMLADFIDEDLDRVGEDEEALAELRGNADRLGEQTARARALVGGVMSYFHLGDRPETLERCDTRRMLETIGRTLGADDGRLQLAGDFPVLETYRTRLDQVLSNLVGNAFKYHDAPERAAVRVSVRDEGEFVAFCVADDGPGIDERHHETIFELFGTLEPRPGVDSTGVGLAIVKRIVEQLGGRISVESSVGRGTAFTFLWPRVITDERRAELAEAA